MSPLVLLVLLFLHQFYGSCRSLDIFRINFWATLFLAIFLQSPSTHFLHIIFNSSNHLFLGFPTDLFPSGIFLNNFFTFLFFCGILYTCPTLRTLPFFGFWDKICFSIHVHQLLFVADPPYVIFFDCDKHFSSIFPTSWGESIAFHYCPDLQTGHYCRPNYHVTLTGSRILG